MALDEVFSNVSDSVPLVLTEQIVDKIGSLIVVLRALGVIAVLYVSYLVYMVIINIKRNKRLIEIEDKLKLMDSKINKLVKLSSKV